MAANGRGRLPFFLQVRPDTDIHKMEYLQGKTVGTFIGLDPQNAFIQSPSAELKATAEG